MLEGAVAQAKTSNSPPSSSPPLFSLPLTFLSPMFRLKRISFLVAAIVFATQCVADVAGTVPGNRVALVFTDVKLDDKVAIDVLTHKNYERVIAVITAVADKDQAHGDLLDFLGKMNNKERTTTVNAPAELIVFKVEEDWEEVAHEVNFLGKSTPTNIYNKDTIAQYISDATVDIFQIAPTKRKHIRALIPSNSFSIRNIALYHLIHGFNSGGNGNDESLSFLQAIGKEIHGAYPKAEVVFTNNHASFQKDGGTQPYKLLKDGQLPFDHLVAASKDPFHVKQFTNAVNVVEQATMLVVVDRLQRAAQLMSKSDWSKLDLKLEDFKTSELPKRILEAEKDFTKMEQFLNVAKGVDVFVQEYLKKEGPLRTPLMDMLTNEKLPAIKQHVAEDGATTYTVENEFEALHNFMHNTMSDNKGWEDALEAVKTVKAVEAVEVEVGGGWWRWMVGGPRRMWRWMWPKEAVNEYAVFYDPNKPLLPALKWKDFGTLADTILRARQNTEGEISEALRGRFLHFMEAVNPVVLNWHPKSRGSTPFRWEKVVPRAFKAPLTVELCDANHVVQVLEAFTNPESKRKFQEMAFVQVPKKGILFGLEDFKEAHGKTLTELTYQESFSLLKPYLLKTAEEVAEEERANIRGPSRLRARI